MKESGSLSAKPAELYIPRRPTGAWPKQSGTQQKSVTYADSVQSLMTRGLQTTLLLAIQTVPLHLRIEAATAVEATNHSIANNQADACINARA